MQPPVLGAPASGAPRFILPGEGGDDVVRPTKLGQRELDAGAGGLLRPEEDELVLVRENHCDRKLQEVIAGLLRARGLTANLSKKWQG
jgi:hypothetical protein